MKATLFAAAALLLAGSAQASEPTTLSVSFPALVESKGVVMGALYDETGFTAGGEPVAVLMAPVAGGPVVAEMTGLAPGRYGLKVFHDVNADGQLNQNPFGMPIEPVAFSNDAPMRGGPATWADAAFDVTAGANAHVVNLR